MPVAPLTAVLLALAAGARGDAHPSLLSAQPLGGGGSALLVTAGLPFLSIGWAQGTGEDLDAGAQLELDWITSEVFAGATTRRGAGEWRGFDLALRGRAGFLGNFGADWSVKENRTDAGLQVAPGGVASVALRRATLSASVDLPLTLTIQRGGGFIVAPRLGVALETPLYSDLTAGARVGAVWHVATGGAPLAGDPRATVDFTALLTWRIF